MPVGMEFLFTEGNRIVVTNCLPGSVAYEAGIRVGDELLCPPTHPTHNRFDYINDTLKDPSNYPQKLLVDKQAILSNGFPLRRAVYKVRTHSVTNIFLNSICPPINSCVSASEFSRSFEERKSFSGGDV